MTRSIHGGGAAKYFSEEKPARACYAAKALPLGAAVEIEAIAYVP